MFKNSTQSDSTTTVLDAPAATITVAPAQPARKVAQLPPWKVLLHNDEVNDMDYVVDSIVRLARATVPTATRCMVEAHRKGVSLITVTHREHAELLCEQFHSARMVVTIEPDSR
ncbi:MAG: ATP-dependent Clp protease adaptor ClpS [Phycisphaerales bacterium]|nr:ATP-dependent Clp protease adaptor ClpS [Phycisphaerales bacterium]